MNNGLLLDERTTRIQKAVSLDKPDRVPVVLEYAGFAAFVTGTPMAEFISSPARATHTMIEAYNCVGNGDAINYGSFSAHGLSYSFGARVLVPGVDLPHNEMWQVVETQIMTSKDYDTILDMGWKAFFKDYLAHRIFKNARADLLPDNQEPVDVSEKWAVHGVPVLSGMDVTLPFELLCGGRSLEKFFLDLITIPDKIEAVMDEIVEHLELDMVKNVSNYGHMMAWVGGWRTAPCMISPQMWDRFVWPYFRRLVNAVIDAGLIPLLHLDADWERELSRFKEFPKGKIIVALDGDTNIFKAREILDGHTCIMGDVPACRLAFGTEDEAYKYCINLITRLGPDGFILQSGCDIPANAKLENVQAMVNAATGL